MFFDSFFQDLRIGLRMLVKDKTFFILSVTVLGLPGAGGATRGTGVTYRERRRCATSSATCTAFSAAPLRRLSLLTNSARPVLPSWRTRPT